MIPGFFAAFAAGLLSFLSPCVLPLIPVYISFITGESASDLRAGNTRRLPILIRSLFFVAGFSFVFVLLAVIFGGGMRFIGNSANLVVTRIAGVLVIILGINIFFDFIPFLRGDFRARIAPDFSNGRAILLGMAFAAGWSPCIGPILSSILLYAGKEGNPGRATILLSLYSLGLGVPFILSGIFFARAIPVLGWFKKHMFAIRAVSGGLLVLLGIGMITGSLSGIAIFFLKTGAALEEFSRTAPVFLRPAALFLSRWFTFQGL